MAVMGREAFGRALWDRDTWAEMGVMGRGRLRRAEGPEFHSHGTANVKAGRRIGKKASAARRKEQGPSHAHCGTGPWQGLPNRPFCPQALGSSFLRGKRRSKGSGQHGFLRGLLH